MYRYQPGDLCPFCGATLKDNLHPGVLYAISVAARAMHIPDPSTPRREMMCKLVSQACPKGSYKDHRCCRTCPEYDTCKSRCENSPDHCNQVVRNGAAMRRELREAVADDD